VLAIAVQLQQLPADRGVLLHERAELPEGEPKADEIGGGGDGRRARALVDQGDLAEVVAWLERPPLPAADRDPRLPGVDQEERGGARPLLDDRLTFREPPLLEQAGDFRDLALVQVGEERDSPQDLNRGARHRVRTLPG
jgi:hypothetical protein